MRVHYERHGVGEGYIRYTQRAVELRRKAARYGRPHATSSGPGFKVSYRGRFGIYTMAGKIVTTGRN
jgi:hypothetical protein